MKSINDVVGNLPVEELKNIVKEYYQDLNTRLKYILIEMDHLGETVNLEKEYFDSKKKLQKVNLWDAIYDEFYSQSSERKLDYKRFNKLLLEDLK
jgi:hypothetical protein